MFYKKCMIAGIMAAILLLVCTGITSADITSWSLRITPSDTNGWYSAGSVRLGWLPGFTNGLDWMEDVGPVSPAPGLSICATVVYPSFSPSVASVFDYRLPISSGNSLPQIYYLSVYYQDGGAGSIDPIRIKITEPSPTRAFPYQELGELVIDYTPDGENWTQFVFTEQDPLPTEGLTFTINGKATYDYNNPDIIITAGTGGDGFAPGPEPPVAEPLPPGGEESGPGLDSPSAGTLAWAIRQPVGTDVGEITELVVCTASSPAPQSAVSPDEGYSFDFDGHIYVQSQDRSVGIRVNLPAQNLWEHIRRGQLISRITGTVAQVDDEKQINATDVWLWYPGEEAIPLGITNRDLGGADIMDGETVLAPGVEGGIGLYNKGLLVRVWGKVTYVDPGGAFCYIHDGSAVQDANPFGAPGIRVYLNLQGDANRLNWLNTQPTLPQVGQYISIVGLSSSFEDGGLYYRCVRQRRQFGDVIEVHAIQNFSGYGRGLMVLDSGETYYSVESYPQDLGIWYYVRGTDPVYNYIEHHLGCLDLANDGTSFWGGLYQHYLSDTQCKLYLHSLTPPYAQLQEIDLSSWFFAPEEQPYNPVYGYLDGLAVAPDGTFWISSDIGYRVYHVSAAGERLGSFDPIIPPDTPMPVAGHEFINGNLWISSPFGRSCTIYKFDPAGPNGTVLAFFRTPWEPAATVEDLNWRASHPTHLQGLRENGEIVTWSILPFDLLSQ